MPLEINHTAPAVAERRVLIHAPREQVWGLLADVEDWPRWQSRVSRVELDGQLASGTSFRWKAGGMRITSTLGTVMPPLHIGWEGKTLGLRALHAWHLYPHESGTVVDTAESFEGPLARVLRPFVQRTLDRALDDGLADLKREAETRAE